MEKGEQQDGAFFANLQHEIDKFILLSWEGGKLSDGDKKNVNLQNHSLLIKHN